VVYTDPLRTAYHLKTWIMRTKRGREFHPHIDNARLVLNIAQVNPAKRKHQKPCRTGET